MLWHIFPYHAMLPMLCHICDVMAHISCYGTYSAGERASANMCHNTECKDMSILRVMAQMTCYGTYLSCYGTNDKKYVP